MTAQRLSPTRSQANAALVIGTVALLMLGLQPILLGELVAQKLITLEGVGVVAMGEIICVGLGAIFGDSVLPLTRMRGITVLAALVVAALDLLTMKLNGDVSYVSVRALCGLAEGVLVWVATCSIVRRASPERLASIFLVAQTLAQAAVAAVLALFVIPNGGWQAGFAVLAGLSFMMVFVAQGLCPVFAPLVETGSTRPPFTAATVLTFLVVFFQMGATGSLWAYLDPLGRSAGFDAESVQMLISLVLLMQVIGGSVAGIVVRKGNAVATLVACSLLQAAIALAIFAIGGPAMTRFAVLSAGFGFVWLFLMPFHIRLAFQADQAGRVAVLVPALQLLGVAFGPLLASFFVNGDDAKPVPVVCASFAIGAVCLLLFGRRRFGKSETVDAENTTKFKGKVVLVVGASSGMGRVLALRLAAAGALVAVTARRQDRLTALQAEIERRGGSCLALAADAQDSAAAEQVVAACVERYGRIDLVMLNAGGAPALDMRKMTASQVNDYMRSNYDVVVNYLFPVLQRMVRQGGGMVAHTNSLAGFLGVPLQGPYSAAKAAARLLIDTCRIEFAQYGIKFVTVYPGFVATEKTAEDGMPAPLEISEECAVDHILYALRRERSDYLFPFVMRWLIRLALVLPKAITNRILASEIPPLPPLESTCESDAGSNSNNKPVASISE
jgi:NADP-dependent 3-hydroxy acid dehydrogenase YdfG/predicted MFS family arabinose efflux permease